MDENHETPPPEKSTDSPVALPGRSELHVTPPPDSHFMPPVEQKPSKYRYVWLVVILLLAASVLAVGAYIIDAENRLMPSQINSLQTPTPDMPKPSITVRPTIVASDSAEIATPSAKRATSSGSLQ